MRLEPIGSTTWRVRPLARVVEPAAGTSLLPRRSGPDEHPFAPGHRRRPGDRGDGARDRGAEACEGEELPDVTVQRFAALVRTSHSDVRAPEAGRCHGTARQVIDLTEPHHTIDLRA